jgi:hypothetical protein
MTQLSTPATSASGWNVSLRRGAPARGARRAARCVRSRGWRRRCGREDDREGCADHSHLHSRVPTRTVCHWLHRGPGLIGQGCSSRVCTRSSAGPGRPPHAGTACQRRRDRPVQTSGRTRRAPPRLRSQNLTVLAWPAVTARWRSASPPAAAPAAAWGAQATARSGTASARQCASRRSRSHGPGASGSSRHTAALPSQHAAWPRRRARHAQGHRGSRVRALVRERARRPRRPAPSADLMLPHRCCPTALPGCDGSLARFVTCAGAAAAV